MCCRAMGVDPKTVRREHPPDNPNIRLEMNKIAEKRRRFGHPLAGTVCLQTVRGGALVSCWNVWAW